jgi:hypothetical protein
MPVIVLGFAFTYLDVHVHRYGTIFDAETLPGYFTAGFSLLLLLCMPFMGRYFVPAPRTRKRVKLDEGANSASAATTVTTFLFSAFAVF